MMLSKPYDPWYEALQTELRQTREEYAQPLAAIEAGFRVACRYRSRLPPPGEPVNPIDSVHYYKHELPRFEAPIRFFELCYFLEMFWPVAPGDQGMFFGREQARRSRLVDQDPVLFAYYHTGATELDEAFFGRDPARAERNALLLADYLSLDEYEPYLARYPARFHVITFPK